MAERETNGGGKATQLTENFIASVVRGMVTRVKDILPSTWFSPVQPLNPVAPQAEGRQWDYPVGYNLRLVPKQQEGVTFPQLRDLADGYDVLRLIIERRKDQMVKLKWNIKPIDPTQKMDDDPRVKQLTAFLRVPDGRHPWQMWLRMLLEDMIVCDNACVYPRYDNGEDNPPSKLELINGDTIKPVIDSTGRLPMPPSVAYQQILHGVPAVDYSADQLIYMPRNRRTNKVYGYGFVEQILMTVNIALRRQISQLQYFTDGSVPNLLITAPKEWTPEQITKFNKWFNDKLAGDTAARRQATFIPDGSKPFDTKEAILKDVFDEWLVRVVCFAFSIAPSPFVREMNRATAQTAKEAATEEGLYPIMQWVKDLMDLLIWKYWGYTDLEFGWDEDQAVDPLVQAQIDDMNIKNGTKSVDEVRLDRGDDPIGMPNAVFLPTGPVLLSTLIHQAKTDPTGEKAAQDQAEQAQQQAEAKAAAQGGQNGPGGAGGEQAQGEKPAKAAEANVDGAGKYLGASLKKAVKRGGHKPIDRERGEMKRLTQELATGIAKALADAGKKAADSVRSGKPLGKADGSEPKSADEILAEIDTVGVSVVSDAASSVLEQIFQDGAAEALAQIGMVADMDSLDQLNQAAADYANERGAYLVGKRVQDDGTVVDNPNAEYAIEDTTREMLRADVATAVEQGMSNDELADLIEDNFAFSVERSVMIARTETAFADVQGNLAAYKEGGVEKKQWVKADACCDECAELDGEVVGIDEPFSDGSDGPPQHPNCFLPGTKVSAIGVSAHFERRFSGEVVVIRARGVDEITVTPNHPILTDAGWIAAGALQIGDKLVKCLDPDGLAFLVEPQDHHVKASIEHVPDALRVARNVTAGTMPTAAEDFHGDGVINGEVRVVRADCALPSDVAELGEDRKDSGLARGHLAVRPLDGLRAPAQLIKAGLSSTDGAVSRGGESAPVLGAGVTHAEPHGVAVATDRQAHALPSDTERRTVATDSPSYIHTRLADHVSLVEIEHLFRREYDGHVYNLETWDGWYLANNIVVHNCRCDVLPVFEDDEE